MSTNHDDLSTGGHADLIFEVEPDPDVFDKVRRAVVRRLEDGYADVVPDDLRAHVRIDTVNVDPATWQVEGQLNAGHDVAFDVQIRADADATAELLSYLRSRTDDRYGGYVDASAVVFDRIGMRPRAWFVDAKIPPKHAERPDEPTD